MNSQDKILTIRKQHRNNFIKARDANSGVYLYGSKALREEFDKFDRTPAKYTTHYKVDPFCFQYDLELHIWWNWDSLKQREKELGGDNSFIDDVGFTSFNRYQHLLNAMSIRWPTRVLPNGNHSGDMIITPWLEDFAKTTSDCEDNISFGGGGQGKTYGPLGLMCMTYDHFIFTRTGAQCTYSTVSEDKLKSSTWPYVNKLYPVSPDRRPFSLYAGKAKKCPDYSYIRVDANNKPILVGGKFIGLLLQKGIKDQRVVDKLTGSHDALARIYLLDEAQSTDDAPIDAYTNMFMHPKYRRFFMSGNFDEDTDLLGINVEPAATTGWKGVNEATHMWEGILKSKKNNLGRRTIVTHFNNELSPCVVDSSLVKNFPHMPNAKMRDTLYPTDESKKSIAYKRFWIGFRYEKENKQAELYLSFNIISDYRANRTPKFNGEPINVASFDSAPASVDRNILNVSMVGLESGTGLPLIAPNRLFCFPKPTSDLEYHQQTCKRMADVFQRYGIASGNAIMDWTNRTALIEMLKKEYGITCHHLIYNNAIPKKKQINPQSGAQEDVIPLETIPTFVGKYETNKTSFAHEKVGNRITLGAYIFRLFIEKGRVAGFESSILDTVRGYHNGFEKEFLKRKFIKDKKGIVLLDSKEKFNEDYGFSPDLGDTFHQLFYMLYVIFGIRPHVASLGSLRYNPGHKTEVHKINNIFDAIRSRI
jgi:hypothetical protein